MIGVDNPQKWLLSEITKYLSEEQLAELMRGYADQKARYTRAVAIRRWERMVKIAERWPDDGRLAQWKEKLATLQAEWEAMEETP